MRHGMCDSGNGTAHASIICHLAAWLGPRGLCVFSTGNATQSIFATPLQNLPTAVPTSRGLVLDQPTLVGVCAYVFASSLSLAAR